MDLRVSQHEVLVLRENLKITKEGQLIEFYFQMNLQRVFVKDKDFLLFLQFRPVYLGVAIKGTLQSVH
jgi:predicted CDP-diglyceride synthetase/phosphatidate cytidylyltransferase